VPATPGADAPAAAPGAQTPAAPSAAPAPEAVQAEPEATPQQLEPTMPSNLRAPFTLVVNEVEKGQAMVVLKNGDVFVLRSDLKDVEVTIPFGQDEVIDGAPMLSLKSVSPPVSYELDEQRIVLRLTVPVKFLPTTRVDLSSAPPQVQHQTGTSMFWNYSVSMIDLGLFNAYQELGVSTQGNLMFSSMYMSNQTGPIRGMTNYTINEREKLKRFIVGDTLVQTGPLGAGQLVGGWTVTREYGLNPYAIKAPRIGYQGSTLTPATIDVYVNGVRVRSEEVKPGAFQLDNLRVAGGRGQAVYIIRDIFGQEQRIELPFYIAGNVLAKGLDEYTYSLGVLREDVSTRSWGYTRPAALARHRYGLNDSITLGYRAELGNNLVSGGPSLTTLTKIGQIEAEVGASNQLHKGAGVASYLSYSFLSRMFGGGLFSSLMSTRYANLSQSASDAHLTQNYGAFASLPIGIGSSISANGRYSKARSGLEAWQFSLQGARAIRPGLFGMIWGNYLGQSDGTRTWEIQLAFNYSFKQVHSVLGSLRVTDAQPGGSISASKPLSYQPGYGYRGNATYSADKWQVEGRGQYQTTFGRYGVGYANIQGQQHMALEAAGALALVPGVGLFPTLPVQDAFGVIRVPGIKNVRAFVNNQPIGKTNRHGNVLVPNLFSYYGNRLSIAQEDVPLEYSVQKTEAVIAPPQRGVALATFNLTKPHYYRGSVMINNRGKRIVPEYGQMRVQRETDEVISPLGQLGEFDLSDLAAGEYQAYVDSKDGVCEFKIKVPETAETVVDMGELTCAHMLQTSSP
jgi:outer membrane usher protein